MIDPSILSSTTPRIRTLKQLKRNLVSPSKVANFQEGDEDDPDRPKELPLGFEQLYSYYAPGLQGGEYNIEVKQNIINPQPLDGKSDALDLISNQQFNVNAPRFTLPPGIVHQTYPPQGLGDHNNVLPHIVFEDPHLPWEQEGSPAQDLKDIEAEKSTGQRARNKVPWLALLTFTEDELKLTPQQLAARSAGGLFPEVQRVPSKVVQPVSTSASTIREQDKSTFVLHMTMGEYLEMSGDVGDAKDKDGKPLVASPTVIAPIKDKVAGKELIDRDQQVEVVMVKREHFEKLISPYDASGSPAIIPAEGAPACVSRYGYLAHVRNVNTKNMANAGLEDSGLFSVIHAHRTGPLDLKAPKPVIVHLVSLEGIEDHLKLPLDPTKSHAALVSLYSWTYLCLPPDDVNFVDTIQAIGHEINAGECWLRAPDSVYNSILPKPDDAASGQKDLQMRLAKRVRDGYTLVRYLLQTGEETVAFFRGPLTPTYVPSIEEKWWPYQSNYSSDYQIVDRQLGIVDITYSAAWQLGRTLAMADQAFTAALVRLRGAIQTRARRETKNEIGVANPAISKLQALATLDRSINVLGKLGNAAAGQVKAEAADRFRKTSSVSESSASTVPDSTRQRVFESKVVTSTTSLSSAKSNAPLLGGQSVVDTGEVYIPFNEINVPNSADWQVVQAWVLNNLFLKNIPAHYLIPDPSFLLQEAVRFFYIDHNWMDAFIDGALSVGNHLDDSDDVVRQAFKHSLNNYFAHPYHEDDPKLKYYPQIPYFGFFLRSSIVKAFPNLEVHAPWPGHEDEQDHPPGEPEPTLRLETLQKDVLLCLFDRMPGSKYWSTTEQITLQQPPQQQCFRLGPQAAATTDNIKLQFRRMFTTDDELPPIPGDPTQVRDRYGPIEPMVNWTKDNGLLDNGGPLPSDPRKPIDATKFPLPAKVFDWDARTIVFPAFANACNTMLNKGMTFDNVDDGKGGKTSKKFFDDDVATSAVTGTILTSFVSKMKIRLPIPTVEQNPAPPDTVAQPHRIRIPADFDQDPSTWKRVPVTDEPAPQPKPGPTVLPPKVPAPTPAPSGRPVGLLPFDPKKNKFTYFDPNQNPRIPDSERTSIPKNDKGKILPPVIGPQFACKVFPIGQKPPKDREIPQIPIPSTDPSQNLPFDLVISLTPLTGQSGLWQDGLKPGTTDHKLQLYSLTIDIPIGNTPNHLIQFYSGPGGKMLSNLRFNVHVSPMPDKVRFTLIPRATSRLSPLRKNADLSFCIWQLRPNGVVAVGTKKGQPPRSENIVRITVQENYRRNDDGHDFQHAATAQAMVVKALV